MKKIVLLTILILLLGSLGGCANKNPGTGLVQTQPVPQSSNTTPKKELTIGLVMKTLTNPFFIEMEKGARKAEKEFGIKLIVKTGAKETSIAQQIGIVEDLISMKVDAIVIAPGSSTELVSVLKKAQDAGIKIVNIDVIQGLLKMFGKSSVERIKFIIHLLGCQRTFR